MQRQLKIVQIFKIPMDHKIRHIGYSRILSRFWFDLGDGILLINV